MKQPRVDFLPVTGLLRNRSFGTTPCAHPPPRGVQTDLDQGVVAAQAQEGQEELLHFQVRRGGREETPLVQDKEQWLHFAGAAMKRYPKSKVRETQVRR